jgi:cytochrome c oxidase cbb3-type subunit 2
MKRSNPFVAGWQGVSLVAIIYVYFLIFAQFAFLRRLAVLGILNADLKVVMGAMAAGGIFFSLFTPRIRRWQSPDLRLRIGLGTSSVAALISLGTAGLYASIAVAFLIGSGLAILTVTLVTHLREWTGNSSPLLQVGLGTGLGYFICNLPFVFTATPQTQAILAGSLCLFGICLSFGKMSPHRGEVESLRKDSSLSFTYLLICFAALVWLDSAAFFIIQNAPALKAGTWAGEAHLWINGMLHFIAALLSAWLLSKRGILLVLGGAFVALCCACLLLLNPHRVLLASIFYPVGVSLYSVALVAYPSLLAPGASVEVRGRQAGWLYAIAGWTASAMGIGMGQHLGSVPPLFVMAAGMVILLPRIASVLLSRKREAMVTAAVLLAALAVDRSLKSHHAQSTPSQVERGRRVYISEGCIHCHSQYVRPNSPDVGLWGPTESLAQIRQQQPPLIGNRRQGPDLAQVGGRRSALWIKAHFFNPPEVSGASIMTSSGFLFADERGEDLVAYLLSLRAADTEAHQVAERAWQLPASALLHGNAKDGVLIYQRHCATCHEPGGITRRIWQANLKRQPSDLARGPFFYLSSNGPPAQRFNRLAQIIKYGVPGTDMAGHEYLPDAEIASLSLWLSDRIGQPSSNP